MERFFFQVNKVITSTVRTLGEAFGNTDDDPPATSTVDNIASLECDDSDLRAIAENYNQEGEARLNENEFDDARDFYTNGIELKCKDDALNATMYANRARVHFCVGSYDEALSDVRAAREFQPLHLDAIETGIADGHNKDGDEELRKNEFDSATRCYTEGIEVNCKDDQLNALLYTNRANVHLLVGNYDYALSDAKVARQFQPTFVKAIEIGASACFELELFEEAVTWCNDGLAIEKEERTLHKLRERSLTELCQHRKEESNGAPAPQSPKKLEFLDWSLQKLVKFNTNCRRAITKRVDGNEYDTVYFKTDLSVHSMKGLKKVVNFWKRSLSNVAGESVDDGGDGQVAGFSCLPGATPDIKTTIDFYELELSVNKKIGFKAGEGRDYDNLGIAFQMSGNFKQAIVYHKEQLEIAIELGDRAGQGRAYGNLGTAYYSLNDLDQAIAFFKLDLSIAKEVGQRSSEGRACSNLGLAYFSQDNFQEAQEYFRQHLLIAQEVGDRAGEGRACGNLGLVCSCQGEFQQALKYGEQYLSIAKEIGDRAFEGEAYGNLGNAYHNLSDIEQAIDYYKLHLSIVIELGRREEEGQVYSNLGNACCRRRDFKQAVEYYRLSLNIAKELEDRCSEASAFGGLSDVHYALNDYKQAVEYGTLNLTISKEVGLKSEEAAAYERLGNSFLVLGDFEQALLNYNRLHDAAQKEGDLSGEGHAYGLIGRAYQSLGHLESAIEYHQRNLRIAEVKEDISEQGHAYGNMGLAYQSLGDLEQAIQCFEKLLSMTKDMGDRENEGIVYGNLGDAYLSLADFPRAIYNQELRLNIAEEVGNKVEQGNAFYALGCVYEQMDNLHEALNCFQSCVELFKCVKALLKSKDDWKISFQDNCQFVQIALWRALVKQKKWIEALLAAEEGRAQALMDLMKSQYGLQENVPESDVNEEGILDVQSNTLFLALDENKLNCWLILKNSDVSFRAEEIEIEKETNAKEFIQSLNNHIFEEIEIGAAVNCEDRSLDVLRQDIVINNKAHQKMPKSFHGKHSALRWLYDIIIYPFAVDLVEGDELIIVPDGPLCLTPFCVLVDSTNRFLCEKFRLRVVPSLSSLRMILNCSEDCHSRNGVLLVGDPCVEEIVINGEKLPQLPFASTEVEIIGSILMTDPVKGTRATKDEVLRRLNHVALVHIAAHGSMETGEIALCPNPTRSSRIPEKEDFLLTMSDVLNAKLRARLVVLSCCHSGQGKVKAEGVVGIARAFLAAGARSVLVSLWAIDDEATLEFMKRFYLYLLEGRSASESLNQAMKCLRESEEYSDVKYWAPFVLIGDDVTLDFGNLT
ncbi:uncharacterized protein LOC144644750 isoform X3 [Oculina patagonica]